MASTSDVVEDGDSMVNVRLAGVGPWRATEDAIDAAEQVWVDALCQLDMSHLHRSSGCGEWSIADLVGHVAGGGERYAMLLSGGSAEDAAGTRGTDYVGGDPLSLFWIHKDAFRVAVSVADLSALVDHRAGPCSGRRLVDMRIMDLTLHAFDLDHSIGRRWRPPEALLRYLLDRIPPIIDELRRSGLFGPAIAARSDDPAERLLPFAGRTPSFD